MKNNRKAIIFGIKGFCLTVKEKKLFKKKQPWGIILFSRNIKNIIQLRKLTDDIKFFFKDNNYPIFIDQEGGKVSRLNRIIDLSYYSQNYFGKMYIKNKIFSNYYSQYINGLSDILKSVGININTVPVLDVKRNKTHNIIGTRAFSSNPLIVNKLGKICVESFMKNNIATVIKHVPGHGLANLDSHHQTPIVRKYKNELIAKDFLPFKNSKSLFAMTAHIIYTAYDPVNTATHSKFIIDKVIRKKIKFKGILISDDISMKSLNYKIEENATKALKAGCNLVLHCNGKISEMIKLSKVIPRIDKFTQKKTSHFYKFLR